MQDIQAGSNQSNTRSYIWLTIAAILAAATAGFSIAMAPFAFKNPMFNALFEMPSIAALSGLAVGSVVMAVTLFSVLRRQGSFKGAASYTVGLLAITANLTIGNYLVGTLGLYSIPIIAALAVAGILGIAYSSRQIKKPIRAADFSAQQQQTEIPEARDDAKNNRRDEVPNLDNFFSDAPITSPTQSNTASPTNTNSHSTSSTVGINSTSSSTNNSNPSNVLPFTITITPSNTTAPTIPNRTTNELSAGSSTHLDNLLEFFVTPPTVPQTSRNSTGSSTTTNTPSHHSRGSTPSQTQEDGQRRTSSTRHEKKRKSKKTEETNLDKISTLIENAWKADQQAQITQDKTETVKSIIKSLKNVKVDEILPLFTKTEYSTKFIKSFIKPFEKNQNQHRKSKAQAIASILETLRQEVPQEEKKTTKKDLQQPTQTPTAQTAVITVRPVTSTKLEPKKKDETEILKFSSTFTLRNDTGVSPQGERRVLASSTTAPTQDVSTGLLDQNYFRPNPMINPLLLSTAATPLTNRTQTSTSNTDKKSDQAALSIPEQLKVFAGISLTSTDAASSSATQLIGEFCKNNSAQEICNHISTANRNGLSNNHIIFLLESKAWDVNQKQMLKKEVKTRILKITLDAYAKIPATDLSSPANRIVQKFFFTLPTETIAHYINGANLPNTHITQLLDKTSWEKHETLREQVRGKISGNTPPLPELKSVQNNTTPLKKPEKLNSSTSSRSANTPLATPTPSPSLLSNIRKQLDSYEEIPDVVDASSPDTDNSTPHQSPDRNYSAPPVGVYTTKNGNSSITPDVQKLFNLGKRDNTAPSNSTEKNPPNVSTEPKKNKQTSTNEKQQLLDSSQPTHNSKEHAEPVSSLRNLIEFQNPYKLIRRINDTTPPEDIRSLTTPSYEEQRPKSKVLKKTKNQKNSSGSLTETVTGYSKIGEFKDTSNSTTASPQAKDFFSPLLGEKLEEFSKTDATEEGNKAANKAAAAVVDRFLRANLNADQISDNLTLAASTHKLTLKHMAFVLEKQFWKDNEPLRTQVEARITQWALNDLPYFPKKHHARTYWANFIVQRFLFKLSAKDIAQHIFKIPHVATQDYLLSQRMFWSTNDYLMDKAKEALDNLRSNQSSSQGISPIPDVQKMTQSFLKGANQILHGDKEKSENQTSSPNVAVTTQPRKNKIDTSDTGEPRKTFSMHVNLEESNDSSNKKKTKINERLKLSSIESPDTYTGIPKDAHDELSTYNAGNNQIIPTNKSSKKIKKTEVANTFTSTDEPQIKQTSATKASTRLIRKSAPNKMDYSGLPEVDDSTPPSQESYTPVNTSSTIRSFENQSTASVTTTQSIGERTGTFTNIVNKVRKGLNKSGDTQGLLRSNQESYSGESPEHDEDTSTTCSAENEAIVFSANKLTFRDKKEETGNVFTSPTPGVKHRSTKTSTRLLGKSSGTNYSGSLDDDSSDSPEDTRTSSITDKLANQTSTRPWYRRNQKLSESNPGSPYSGVSPDYEEIDERIKSTPKETDLSAFRLPPRTTNTTSHSNTIDQPVQKESDQLVLNKGTDYLELLGKDDEGETNSSSQKVFATATKVVGQVVQVGEEIAKSGIVSALAKTTLNQVNNYIIVQHEQQKKQKIAAEELLTHLAKEVPNIAKIQECLKVLNDKAIIMRVLIDGLWASKIDVAQAQSILATISTKDESQKIQNRQELFTNIEKYKNEMNNALSVVKTNDGSAEAIQVFVNQVKDFKMPKVSPKNLADVLRKAEQDHIIAYDQVRAICLKYCELNKDPKDKNISSPITTNEKRFYHLMGLIYAPVGPKPYSTPSQQSRRTSTQSPDTSTSTLSIETKDRKSLDDTHSGETFNLDTFVPSSIEEDLANFLNSDDAPQDFTSPQDINAFLEGNNLDYSGGQKYKLRKQDNETRESSQLLSPSTLAPQIPDATSSILSNITSVLSPFTPIEANKIYLDEKQSRKTPPSSDQKTNNQTTFENPAEQLLTELAGNDFTKTQKYLKEHGEDALIEALIDGLWADKIDSVQAQTAIVTAFGKDKDSTKKIQTLQAHIKSAEKNKTAMDALLISFAKDDSPGAIKRFVSIARKHIKPSTNPAKNLEDRLRKAYNDKTIPPDQLHQICSEYWGKHKHTAQIMITNATKPFPSSCEASDPSSNISSSVEVTRNKQKIENLFDLDFPDSTTQSTVITPTALSPVDLETRSESPSGESTHGPSADMTSTVPTLEPQETGLDDDVDIFNPPAAFYDETTNLEDETRIEIDLGNLLSITTTSERTNQHKGFGSDPTFVPTDPEPNSEKETDIKPANVEKSFENFKKHRNLGTLAEELLQQLHPSQILDTLIDALWTEKLDQIQAFQIFQKAVEKRLVEGDSWKDVQTAAGHKKNLEGLFENLNGQPYSEFQSYFKAFMKPALNDETFVYVLKKAFAQKYIDEAHIHQMSLEYSGIYYSEDPRLWDSPYRKEQQTYHHLMESIFNDKFANILPKLPLDDLRNNYFSSQPTVTVTPHAEPGDSKTPERDGDEQSPTNTTFLGKFFRPKSLFSSPVISYSSSQSSPSSLLSSNTSSTTNMLKHLDSTTTQEKDSKTNEKNSTSTPNKTGSLLNLNFFGTPGAHEKTQQKGLITPKPASFYTSIVKDHKKTPADEVLDEIHSNPNKIVPLTTKLCMTEGVDASTLPGILINGIWNNQLSYQQASLIAELAKSEQNYLKKYSKEVYGEFPEVDNAISEKRELETSLTMIPHALDENLALAEVANFFLRQSSTPENIAHTLARALSNGRISEAQVKQIVLKYSGVSQKEEEDSTKNPVEPKIAQGIEQYRYIMALFETVKKEYSKSETHNYSYT